MKPDLIHFLGAAPTAQEMPSATQPSADAHRVNGRNMKKERTAMEDRKKLLEVILNLSKYHREHEKFYAQSPLQNAMNFIRLLAH
jgi:hypothetical protein